MIIILHGFGSYDNDCKYTAKISELFDSQEIVMPKYSSTDANKSACELRQLVLTSLLDGKEITLVGIGTGCFWAKWLHGQYLDVNVISIKPELSPVTSLSNKLNTFIEDVLFTKQRLEAFGKYSIKSEPQFRYQ